MNIKITMFDDNAQRREGFKMMLSVMDDMECVGAFEDCRNVLANIAQTNPDIVLMDIDMPYVDGIEGVKIIRTQYPDLKILMQTVVEENDKIFAAICAGADGYILKQASPAKLIEAILRHRDELGGFQSLDQLADIPGIKTQRVRVLTRYLRLSPTPDSNQTSPPSQ